MGVISLEGLKFFAYHGVYEVEKVHGNNFIVDIEIVLDLEKSAQTDDLSLTIDYEKIFTVVSNEMATRSKLLEHVSSRICNTTLKNWNQIQQVKVKVAKLNPSIGGDCKMSSVTITRKKE